VETHAQVASEKIGKEKGSIEEHIMLSNLLQGTQVTLNAMTESDLPTIVTWFQDTRVLRLLDALPARPKTEHTLRQWLTENAQSNNTYLFAIRRTEDNTLVGYVELDGILWTHGTSGIGIVIGAPENWGKGYAREAAQLALNFAFQELNLHRITATIFNYNTRSQALFEKLGFQREGAFREFLQRDGQRHDMLLYGLLRHEWESYQQ
jgi:RimJ/RimL family protein N-acetyltransferase